MQLADYLAQAEPMPAQPLYSPTAVRVFAFVFGPVFGGVMAYHNLRDLGRPEPARKLLWACLLFTAVVLLVGVFLPVGRLTTPLNIVGALWLGNHYEQLVPGAKQYPRKPIWKPLVVSLLITVPFLWLALAPLWQ